MLKFKFMSFDYVRSFTMPIILENLQNCSNTFEKFNVQMWINRNSAIIFYSHFENMWNSFSMHVYKCVTNSLIQIIVYLF